MANKDYHIKEAYTHTESSASSATKFEPEKLNELSSFPAPRQRTDLKQTDMVSDISHHANFVFMFNC